MYGNKVPVRSWPAVELYHMGSDGSDLPCVCVSLVFCRIVLSKQVERPVVMRDTAVVWEDMRERESDHSEKRTRSE